MAKVIPVIITTIPRGKGTENDIRRTVTQYFSLDGNLLFEDDPVKKEIEKRIVREALNARTNNR